MARIIDTLVAGLPVVLIARATLPEATAEAVASVGLCVLLLLYESLQLALWGQTLGKRLVGIMVVPEGREEAREETGEGTGERGGQGSRSATGGGLGVARACLRSAVYALPIALRPVPVLDVIAGIFWVGGVALLFTGTRQQALHDRLARTFVVRSGLKALPRRG